MGSIVVGEKTRPFTIEKLDRSKFHLTLVPGRRFRSPLVAVRCNVSKGPPGFDSVAGRGKFICGIEKKKIIETRDAIPRGCAKAR